MSDRRIQSAVEEAVRVALNHFERNPHSPVAKEEALNMARVIAERHATKQPRPRANLKIPARAPPQPPLVAQPRFYTGWSVWELDGGDDPEQDEPMTGPRPRMLISTRTWA